MTAAGRAIDVGRALGMDLLRQLVGALAAIHLDELAGREVLIGQQG